MPANTLPHLTWLRAFEASARHMSFTLAAQELDLTQASMSAISNSISGAICSFAALVRWL